MPRTTSSAVYSRWLGQRLRAARQEVGISQAELALRLGTSQPYIAAVEAGRENLTIGQIASIATALGVVFDITFSRPAPIEASLTGANAPVRR